MVTGILINVVCNLIFVAVGYAIHYFLGAVMTPAEYGVIGSILTILDFEYLFLNNGVRQSLSKEISSARYRIGDLVRKGILFQLCMMVIICSINLFGSGLFGTLLHDSSIPHYIRLACLMVISNGSFVIAVGITEGLRKFVSAAMANLIYSLCKLSVIPYVLWVFADPVEGAEIGYATAGVIGVLAGCLFLFKNRALFASSSAEVIPFGRYVRNTLNFSLFFIIVSVVMSMDTLIVKGRIADSNMAGYYTGAVNFSKVSYFILQAFFTILLPTLTRAYSDGKNTAVLTIADTMEKAVLALVLPITVIISTTSADLLRCFYNEAYTASSGALTLLSFAHFLIGLVVMYNMMLSAMDRRRFSVILSVTVLAADLTLCFLLTDRFGITGTAAAGCFCGLCALIASVICVKKVLRGLCPGADFKYAQSVRLIIASALLWIVLRAASGYIHLSSLILLGGFYAAAYAAIIAVYHFSGLFNIRELLKSMKQ